MWCWVAPSRAYLNRERKLVEFVIILIKHKICRFVYKQKLELNVVYIHTFRVHLDAATISCKTKQTNT